MKDTTHFGFKEIPSEEKSHRVREVFNSVAHQYDLMNDLMSLGLHRLWKRVAIESIAIRPGMQVVDLAAGTGDLGRSMAKRTGSEGNVILADINDQMLRVGRNLCINQGRLKGISWCQCDAENLPYSEDCFDRITIGFGLRNVTNKELALKEMLRVLKPGGKALILEFSKPISRSFTHLYDIYSFSILPLMGQLITQDKHAYQYLAESIRKHPDQETLSQMMKDAGFTSISYQNLSGGIVAIHIGMKS